MKILLKALKAYLKKLFSDLHSIILGTIVGVVILSLGGILAFSKNAWTLLKTIVQSSTPLWATIVLVLVLLVYIYLKNPKKKKAIPLSTPDPEYREEFHVYWDKNNKMRCLNCGKPLKNSSQHAHIFHCCDPNCDSKHVLKDDNSHAIIESEAIELLKQKYSSFN